MANNVYIGMRYVPIFLGDWDNTISYEALSIVLYGNNTYTSKKPVPVGTLPTDTSYWVLTGNYNGMIAALQQTIGDLNQLNTPIQSDIVHAINSINDFANVKTYGAVGDDSTDDTQAFLDAIATGRPVFVPAGTYKITSTLTPATGQLIMGSKSAIIKKYTTSELFVLNSNVTLMNLKLNGNNTSGEVVRILGSWNNIINVMVEAMARGFRIYGTVGNPITGNYFDNVVCENATDIIMDIENSNDDYFVNCVFDCINTNAGKPLFIGDHFNEAHTFVNCSFLRGNGASLGESSKCKAIKYTNCFFDHIEGNVMVAGNVIDFVNCWIANRGNNGVNVTGENINFDSCNFDSCKGVGISVKGTAKCIRVDNCNFLGCYTAGIMTETGFDFLSVTNCSFRKKSPRDAYNYDMAEGIHLTGGLGNAPDHLLIAQNMFDTITDPILPAGLHDGTGRLVINNIT